ncbi:hypothetical protein IP69_18900 [Bosea sp. AAP35]|uniref:hypothetical protein n=1 Tax=Bosea sp. AAP35 TaxID=1523417 RepID=UPI0006B93145|nr:hypothetical protein [Bosea sp. AAP35]KPF63449.1 hypothetical protein IP69_18900 [Bosea sp. AAP35]
MQKILMAVCLIGSSMTFMSSEANAVVCARGVVRAGCVSAGGAVAVRRPVAVAPRAVVVAPRAVVVAPRRAVVRRPVRY